MTVNTEKNVLKEIPNEFQPFAVPNMKNYNINLKFTTIGYNLVLRKRQMLRLVQEVTHRQRHLARTPISRLESTTHGNTESTRRNLESITSAHVNVAECQR